MSEAQARSTLQRAGFLTGNVSRVNSRAAAGIVISQSVAPGTQHDPRAPIGLQISLGQKPEIEVAKPPVINPELLKPGVIRPTEPEAPSRQPPHDDVQPGTAVPRPPVFNPDVFKGLATPPVRPPQPELPPEAPPPDDVRTEFIVVPQLREANLRQARARLELRRLKLGRVDRRPSERPAGVVIDQSPEAGTRLSSPAAVNIVLSTGPELVTVPDVLRRPLAEAQQMLSPLSQGQIDVQWVASSQQRGIVLRQAPAAGSRIKPSPPPRFRLHVSTGPPRLVPNVVGQSLPEAERMIGRADLRVGTVREVESDAAAGRVIDQKPKGGTDIVANRVAAVDLLISRGPPARVPLQVPNVIGSREQAAQAQITAAGLSVGTIARERTPEPQGIVVDQKPRGGTQVPRDETVRVDLLVSLGPAATPAPQTMPDLLGRSLDAVPSVLAPLELAIAQVRARASTEPKGTVVAQQPAAGAPVEPGSRVDVTVSDGSRVRVPALVGRHRDEAAQLLRSSELNASASTRQSQQRQGVVLEQSPQAGAEAERGSTVQMIVAVPAPESDQRVVVPDVIGLPITTARQRVEAAGLAVVTDESDSLTYETGTVAVQDPRAAAQVARDSTVQLTVSLGLPALPNLVGLPLPQARGQLAQLGLSATVSEQRVDDQPRGLVVAQSPAAGVRPSRGDEIAIVVTTGPPDGAELVLPAVPPAVLVAAAAGGALLLAGTGAFIARRWKASREAEPRPGKRGAIDARVRLDPVGRGTELTAAPDSAGPHLHFRVRVEHGETRLQQDNGDHP